MNLHMLKRYLLTGIVLIILVLGAFFAGQGVLQNLNENTVTYSLDRWQEAGSVPSLSDWQEVYARISQLTYGKDFSAQIDSAVFRDELVSSPAMLRAGNYYRLLALVYEWRNFVDDAPVDIIEELSFRKLAMHAWSLSIQVSPAWPEYWSQLARNKAYIGEYDDTFYRALTMAMDLGRHEAATQYQVILAASISWPYLNYSFDGIDVKSEVLATIEAALTSSHNLTQHLSILSDSGLLEEVCASIDLALVVPRAQQSCNA